MLTTKNAGRDFGSGFCGFRFIFFLFLAITAVLSGCHQGPRGLLDDGIKLIKRGEYSQAVQKLQQATALLNTNALAWNYLGLAYHHAGQPNEAADAYKKALALDQNLVEVHYDLGCLWLEQDRPEQAKADLTAYTLRRGDKSADGWVKLGEAQMRLHDLAGAEKSFNQARLLDSENPEALNELGMLQMERNHVSEAAAYFNAAVKAKPDYAPAILNLAILSQSRLNSPQYALQCYHQYLDLKPRPTNWDAVDAAARALEQQLTPTPSGAVSRPPAPPSTPARSGPPTFSASRTASNVASRATSPKNTQLAANNSRLPSQPQPQPSQTSEPVEVLAPEPVVHSAADTGSTGQTQPAPSIAESPKAYGKQGFFSRMNPANLFHGNSRTNAEPEAQTHPSGNPAQVASANPEPQSAVNYSRYSYHSIRKPADENRSGAEKAFKEGSQAQQAGQLAEAAQAYQRAIEADPGYFDPYYNLGVVSVRSGKLSQGLLAYETALAIQPDSHDARFNFALALKQANYPIDAARELERLLAKSPNDVNAHYALATIYAQQLHEPARARPHYQKVLDLDPGFSQAYAIHDWLWANP